MRLWFRSIAALLGYDGGEEASIRSILSQAAGRSSSIGIGTVDGVALPSPLSGHVVELEAEALVISRPFAAEKGFHHGEVEVLGRWVSGEGATRRYGYRVSLPSVLMHEERRGLHRIPVAFDLAPKAVLLRPNTLAAIGEGIVVDISEGGMCVRVDLHTLLRPDESVIVRAEFPAILPPIHARTTVAHVMDARQPGHSEIGLRFNEPQAELGHAIRDPEHVHVHVHSGQPEKADGFKGNPVGGQHA